MFDAISSETLIVWESSSSNARETLVLDFENSPTLEGQYRRWKESLSSLKGKDVLMSLNIYLRDDVFDLQLSNKKTIFKLLSCYEIPLEYFVQNKIGMCRHFSLAAYYFLEKLRREELTTILSFEIVRGNLEKGRHAWLNVAFEDGSFHFDPYWGILADRSQSEAMEAVGKLYGNALL